MLRIAGSGMVLMMACGGSHKPAAEGPPPSTEETEPAEDPSQILIPPEKLDAIEATFTRHVSEVSRCFPKAVEAGELQATDKGYVTVGLTVTESGAPENVRAVEATLDSQVLKDCVTAEVSSWEFTTLPKPLDYSHTYVFERL
ncbi:MAG TPA: AgmX/PglI C-terminal domain-containing protein [Kofleriaceae bacterium]|nr:AgmX/PglI C-terminal domain-containing protein [Kofleriaceae bacterium]